MSVTPEQINNALKECYDPEIPVNIVDLGLIYDVHIIPPNAGPGEEQEVEVIMTMTSPGCPSHAQIGDDVRQRVGSIPGIREVKVQVVWMPPWSPERLSPAARKQLGIE